MGESGESGDCGDNDQSSESWVRPLDPPQSVIGKSKTNHNNNNSSEFWVRPLDPPSMIRKSKTNNKGHPSPKWKRRFRKSLVVEKAKKARVTAVDEAIEAVVEGRDGSSVADENEALDALFVEERDGNSSITDDNKGNDRDYDGSSRGSRTTFAKISMKNPCVRLRAIKHVNHRAFQSTQSISIPAAKFYDDNVRGAEPLPLDPPSMIRKSKTNKKGHPSPKWKRRFRKSLVVEKAKKARVTAVDEAIEAVVEGRDGSSVADENEALDALFVEERDGNSSITDDNKGNDGDHDGSSRGSRTTFAKISTKNPCVRLRAIKYVKHRAFQSTQSIGIPAAKFYDDNVRGAEPSSNDMSKSRKSLHGLSSSFIDNPARTSESEILHSAQAPSSVLQKINNLPSGITRFTRFFESARLKAPRSAFSSPAEIPRLASVSKTTADMPPNIFKRTRAKLTRTTINLSRASDDTFELPVDSLISSLGSAEASAKSSETSHPISDPISESYPISDPISDPMADPMADPISRAAQKTSTSNPVEHSTPLAQVKIEPGVNPSKPKSKTRWAAVRCSAI